LSLSKLAAYDSQLVVSMSVITFNIRLATGKQQQ